MVNSGPIPGANFTSDTKNYPWHQPPKYTDISEALDRIVEKLMADDADKKVAALAEVGIPLYRVAGLIVMEGVSEGQWTVDLGLLLVGPVCKVLEIICVQYGIEYDVGIEEKSEFVTGFFVKSKNVKPTSKVIRKELPEIKKEAVAQEKAEPEADIQQEGFAAMNKPQSPKPPTPAPQEETF